MTKPTKHEFAPDPVYMIDGKEVKRFIFCRHSRILGRAQPVEVWAFNKDHAIMRLNLHYEGLTGWDFVDEISGDQTLGKMGDILRLDPLQYGREYASAH